MTSMIPQQKQAWLAEMRAAHDRAAAVWLAARRISLFLVETAASTHACYGVDLSHQVPVGIEVNGTHLRAATQGTLVATGCVLRRGRTHIVDEVDVVLEESGEVLCRGRMTNYYKQKVSR